MLNERECESTASMGEQFVSAFKSILLFFGWLSTLRWLSYFIIGYQSFLLLLFSPSWFFVIVISVSYYHVNIFWYCMHADIQDGDTGYAEMHEVKKPIKNENSDRWNLKKIKKFLGHIGLLLAFTTYTVIGALIFRELEHPAEISRFNELIENLEDRRFKLIKFSFVCSQDAVKCNQLLNDYELAVSEACQGGVQLPFKSSDEVTSRWSFPQSAFFASTVLTTIGYGNTVPNTFWGRLFCILFALIGIPLTLSLIADLGVLMATSLSTLHAKIKLYFPNKSAFPNLSTSEQRWLSALAGVVFLVLYLAAGGAIFMILEEDWGFFEGFYFCFITMTTIGFGDLVPRSPNYMLMCTLYILVGLALTSTIIELVRRQYARSWKTLQALTGPLAESLRRLGESAGTGIDVTMLHNDLRKILTVMSVPRKTDDGREWQDAIDSVLRDISVKSPIKKSPQVLQIVVYETTV